MKKLLEIAIIGEKLLETSNYWVYVIDVNATDAQGAAVKVHRIMQDPDSLAQILEIIDSRGKVTRIDLAEDGNHGKEDSAHA